MKTIIFALLALLFSGCSVSFYLTDNEIKDFAESEYYIKQSSKRPTTVIVKSKKPIYRDCWVVIEKDGFEIHGFPVDMSSCYDEVFLYHDVMDDIRDREKIRFLFKKRVPPFTGTRKYEIVAYSNAATLK